MTTERIDVLAVLGNVSAVFPMFCAIDGLTYSQQDVREARAAVAELIEAASEMNRLAKGPAGGVSQEEKRAIVSRMDAALARIGAP